MIRHLLACLVLGLTPGLTSCASDPAPRQPLSPDMAALANAYPALKVTQESGLPVRFAREDWPKAKHAVATDPGWGRWLAARRQSLDRWLEKPRDKPEWVAGLIHDLVDPSSKHPMRWSENMAEPPAAQHGKDKLHGAWVAGTRANNIAQTLEAARLYKLTGERRYADWAAGQLDFYAQHFAQWPLRSLGGKARMMAQGLDDATSAVTLVQAVRLLRTHVSSARLATWRDRLFLPIAANLGNSPNKVDNIRLWQNTARAMIGMEFGNESLIHDSLDGPWGTRTVLGKGVSRDFLWIEGSLGYQSYVLRALAPLFVEASLQGRGPELEREMLVAQNMLLAPIAMRFDDGTLPNPSDSTRRPRAIDIGLHLELCRVLPTSICLNAAKLHKNWNLLLDPPQAVTQTNPSLPPVASHHYRDDSMAILRKGPWQVFLNYGQHSPNHAQQEALNTEIYFDETPISIDPGTVYYGAPLHRDYFRQGAAANGALVDGEGQQGPDPGRMDAFSADPPQLSASQPRYRKDAEARRTIRFEGDTLVDNQGIKLTGNTPAPRRLGFLFHTACQASLEEDAGTPQTTSPPLGPGMEYWQDVGLRHPTGKSWHARLDCGRQDFTAEFTVSGEHRLYTAKAPSTPLPNTRSVFYVELEDKEAGMEMRLTPLSSKAETQGTSP